MEVRGYRIFYIDKMEDIDKIINRIKSTTAQKLALVIHTGHPLLTGEDDLELIKELEIEFKKDIVLINPEPQVNRLAERSGLNIYSDLEALTDNLSSKDKDDKKRIKKHNRDWFYTGVGIIIILALAWIYFFYPVVTIEISPVIKYKEQEMVLTGSLSGQRINWENQVLPLHKFEVTLTDEDKVETTGKKLIGETRATGSVKFINERKEDVIIPAGVKLKSENGIFFETLREIKIPRLKVDYLMDVAVGMKAGQAEVKIRALNKGSRGNVSTGKINKMVKPVDKIHVINPGPTRGGKDKELPLVSKKDLSRVKDKLNEKIRSKLLSRVYQKLGGNYRIIDNQIDYSKIRFEFNHEAGDAADFLRGTGTLIARGYMLRNNELDRMATKLFRENIEANYRLLSTGVNINKLTLAERKDGLYNIKLELKAPVIPQIDSEILVNKIAGLSTGAAEELLANRQDIEDFKIKSNSDFLPKLNFAIKVKVIDPDSYEVIKITD